MSPGAEHMRQSVIADRLDQPEGPDDDMPIVMAVVDVPGGQWTVSSARKGTQIKTMYNDYISSVYVEKVLSPYPTTCQTFHFSPRSPSRSLNPSTLHTAMTRTVSTPLHHIMSQHKLTPTLPPSLPFRCECGPLTNSGTARSTSPIHFCVGTVFCPFSDGIDGMAHTLLRRARREGSALRSLPTRR